jgi:hypothetical protein
MDIVGGAVQVGGLGISAWSLRQPVDLVVFHRDDDFGRVLHREPRALTDPPPAA